MTWVDGFDSSNIQRIGYEKEDEKLTVVFKNGKTYVYDSVTESVFDDFQSAKSKGKFFNQSIRGVYEFNQV